MSSADTRQPSPDSPSAPACSAEVSISKGPINIDKALLESCIHCGLCLPACPTYLATGRESESPRGRIYLLTQASSGLLPVDDRMVEHIDSCLGCMGCQTACPSGVHYEEILAKARQQLAGRRPSATGKLMREILGKVLPDYKRLRALGSMLRFWQSSPMAKALGKNSRKPRVLEMLAGWQELLPLVPPHKELPKQSWKAGKKAGEAQLFSGCVMDIFYNHVNHAAVRLLVKQGWLVKVPEQTCCGALAAHAGEVEIARKLARRNIDLLCDTAGDIVVTSAGCGAMLKEYGKLLADEPQYAESAREFSARTKDITEKLAEPEPSPFEAEPSSEFKDDTVAYHAACHLAHVQKVRSAPEKLLNNETLKLVKLEEEEHCCGSAGIYNLLHPQMSEKVLERKMTNIVSTGATIVVTTNPGCQLQLEHGARTRSPGLRVMHLVELLDRIHNPE